MLDRAETGGRQAYKTPGQEFDFLDAVLDTVGALVVMLDHEGRIVRFNRAGLDFTATATDDTGNTSEFSVPQPVSWTCNYLYLPLLLRQSL